MKGIRITRVERVEKMIEILEITETLIILETLETLETPDMIHKETQKSTIPRGETVLRILETGEEMIGSISRRE